MILATIKKRWNLFGWGLPTSSQAKFNGNRKLWNNYWDPWNHDGGRSIFWAAGVNFGQDFEQKKLLETKSEWKSSRIYWSPSQRKWAKYWPFAAAAASEILHILCSLRGFITANWLKWHITMWMDAQPSLHLILGLLIIEMFGGGGRNQKLGMDVEICLIRTPIDLVEEPCQLVQSTLISLGKWNLLEQWTFSSYYYSR